MTVGELLAMLHDVPLSADVTLDGYNPSHLSHDVENNIVEIVSDAEEPYDADGEEIEETPF